VFVAGGYGRDRGRSLRGEQRGPAAQAVSRQTLLLDPAGFRAGRAGAARADGGDEAAKDAAPFLVGLGLGITVGDGLLRAGAEQGAGDRRVVQIHQVVLVIAHVYWTGWGRAIFPPRMKRV
jgi:hypothetical protein